MQQALNRKKTIVAHFLKKGILVNQEFLEKLRDKTFLKEVTNLIGTHHHKITVLNNKLKELLEKTREDVNWSELDKLKTLSEKNRRCDFDKAIEPTFFQADKNIFPEVKVVFSYNEKPRKREASNFVDYFTNRYRKLCSILKHRQELQSTISISRATSKRERDQISLIGLVTDKQYTKNNNCLLTIEDETGSIRILVNKNKKDTFNLAKDIVLDEVIGVTGTNSENIVFANNILFPDIPVTTDLKKADNEAYAIFLSDLHVGSVDFLQEDFEKFLLWINQNLGNEAQRRIASKVKYVFVLGDLVDGCGIYPGQETELTIKDIKEQYKECARLLGQIPKHINMIICPGNHDAMRIAEPQLPFYKDFAEPLYQLQNTTIVSNPSLVNIHSSALFSGFDVMLYHGYSFDYYVAEVESIRNNGGYDRADLIMRFLLQKRHLAPTHSSTLYIPDTDRDPLVIEKVPDFFVSGHIHKTAAANYRNVTMLSGSCWQRKTAFQEKVGHHPEPSKVPVVNLKTRNIKILKFGNQND